MVAELGAQGSRLCGFHFGSGNPYQPSNLNPNATGQLRMSHCKNFVSGGQACGFAGSLGLIRAWSIGFIELRVYRSIASLSFQARLETLKLASHLPGPPGGSKKWIP